jgi:arylsulfatase A-like enzyme
MMIQGNNNVLRIVFTFLITSVFATMAPCVVAQPTRPNIIHILADDLGWGSVGFNNPSTYIQTPNIDALANGGMKLTRSYASTVCSPTRASLMTGFHNGRASNDRNASIGVGLRPQDVTVGNVLGNAGYQTAIIGKWGWGADSANSPVITNAGTLPTNQGFDEFYGYLNHTSAHSYYYPQMWQSSGLNSTTVTTPNNAGPGGSAEYSHDLFTRKSEAFIRDNATSSQPFYMQVSYTIPHFTLSDVDVAPALTNLANQTIYPGGQAQYASNAILTTSEKRHAAMISRMDASIGSLVQRLQDPNGDGNFSDSVLANTLIVFSSDNGASAEGIGATSAASNAVSGGLRGGKRDLYEGGIRMPTFAFWQGTIAAGSSSTLTTDVADFQATAAELAGTKARVGTDGVSILPTLVGSQGQRDRGGLVFENFENSQFGQTNSDWSVVREDMKLIKFRDGSYQLFNLSTDRNEQAPLDLSNPSNAVIRAQLEAYAIAQGAGQVNGYGVAFRDWKGVSGAEVTNASNYEVTKQPTASVGPITETWSTLIENRSSSPQSATMSKSMTVLGLEVSGQTHQQEVDVRPGKVLNGRNEIRIGDHGKIQLTNGQLKSDRWLDVQAGGVLTGQGIVQADVYNSGTIKPGFDGVIASPRPPTRGGDFNVAMDFSSIDNRAVKDDVYTPLTRTTSQAAVSLDYGPSAGSRLTDRGFNDFANEFNLQNWTVGGTLQNALNENTFLSLKVDPIEGLAVELRSVAFDFWRNGVNSPSQYAILTNLNGFNTSSGIATTTVTTTGSANTTRFQATGTGLSTTDQIEARLYGWGAGNVNGHSHFTAAELDLLFSTVMEIPLSPAGRLLIEGDLFHSESSFIEMGFGGLDNSNLFAPQFDFLQVAGDVSLLGGLKLFAQDGFALSGDTQITFLQAASVTGSFSSLEAIGFGGYNVSLVYGSDSVSAMFSAVPEPSAFPLVVTCGLWCVSQRRRTQ